ncbi:DMT family transporter [Ramlibacter sp. G-1-2-2]|uniref:DMT family transporter n=1 Tax=Ramlibacter agri TaxID=2728837 RepID=A0A848HAI6_9BURK|nr:DMT family transporter [Ramlibacter agri]NML46470.1 DMT family transporter [Ramlibacter agri]
MSFRSSVAAASGPTSLFVLLWSSGALFAKWGLAYASAFTFLSLRFALALAVLSVIALRRGRWLPLPGTRKQVALTGLVLVGCYSVFYLLALAHGMTPGVLATVMGVQPLLTLALTERPLSLRRIAGLLLALAGLALVVFDSLLAARLGLAGVLAALAALAAMTWGTLLQKRLQQAPLDVLPLQYAVALALCLLALPFAEVRVQWSAGLALSVGWLALVISVAATLLLYRLIQAGNLVNVTSLFYLVPGGTALLDWAVLGNAMAPAAIAGLGAIVGGLLVAMIINATASPSRCRRCSRS